MASNQLNEEPIIVTGSTQAAIPTPTDGAGTFATFGIAIVGVGTKFKSELPRGSYLYDATHKELRIVDRVDSDIKAFLRVAFSNDFAASTNLIGKVIHRTTTNIRQYIFDVDSTANGKMVDSAGTMQPSLLKGAVTPFPIRDGYQQSFYTPTIIDSNGGTIAVTIVR